MAKHNKQQDDNIQDPEVVVESVLSTTEKFLEKRGKTLLQLLIVLVIVVGGYFAYKYTWAEPREAKASDMMFVAEQQFANDSLNLALNGDGNNAGFLDVIEAYGSTRQGNMAAHSAGVCYLRLGDYDNAVKYLSMYSNTDGVPNAIVNAQNRGLIGDAYSQKGDLNSAVKFYNEAVEVSDNQFTAPLYLKKAGLVYAKLGDNQKAIDSYQSIIDNYPNSLEARDIDKYIGQIEQQ